MLSDPISKRTLMDELLASVSPHDIRYNGELGDIFRLLLQRGVSYMSDLSMNMFFVMCMRRVSSGVLFEERGMRI